MNHERHDQFVSQMRTGRSPSNPFRRDASQGPPNNGYSGPPLQTSFPDAPTHDPQHFQHGRSPSQGERPPYPYDQRSDHGAYSAHSPHPRNGHGSPHSPHAFPNAPTHPLEPHSRGRSPGGGSAYQPPPGYGMPSDHQQYSNTNNLYPGYPDKKRYGSWADPRDPDPAHQGHTRTDSYGQPWSPQDNPGWRNGNEGYHGHARSNSHGQPWSPQDNPGWRDANGGTAGMNNYGQPWSGQDNQAWRDGNDPHQRHARTDSYGQPWNQQPNPSWRDNNGEFQEGHGQPWNGHDQQQQQQYGGHSTDQHGAPAEAYGKATNEPSGSFRQNASTVYPTILQHGPRGHRIGYSPGGGDAMPVGLGVSRGNSRGPSQDPPWGRSGGYNGSTTPQPWNERPPAYDEQGKHQRTTSSGPKPTVNLDGIPELNILILGETGVGKSTFINAFVNYIYYNSLDDALDQRGLKCAIPSSFTWQSLQGDQYVPRHISVGQNVGEPDSNAKADEKDGTKGESATQVTKTYSFKIGQTTIQLLDTPGIGDTRGSTQDQENMANILEKLRSITELHGILILLRPNNARLNVMFKFCLIELLTHLHRDAAKNIVFGFTNARNTSFRPGETYTTLKTMLDGDPSVGITLDRSITYCFDSESFRCLAAAREGVDIHDMGDIQDYKLSWEKSANETYRMLEHFRPETTAPHLTKESWGLFQTRELVRVLTLPMAEITQTINNNIALQKDQQQELADAMSRGEALESALHLSKVVFEMRELSQPRTVCSDRNCVEYKDDKKIYKSMCHDPCYLEGVEVDKMQCEGLMQCYAFGCGSSMNCTICGHSWQLHLHVLWEPIEKTIQVEDELVSKRISENASVLEVTETAIRTRQDQIKKYEREREIIQKAAGQFAVFLKTSSIKPWNDTKLAYLDHLIEGERGKVEAGGSDKKLKELQADRRGHEEEIRTLTQYIKAGDSNKVLDQDGITDLIDKLFALELTGPNLRKVANQLENIKQSANGKARAQKTLQPGQQAWSKQNVRRSTPAGGGGSGGGSGGGATGGNMSFSDMLAASKKKQAQAQKGTMSGVTGLFNKVLSLS